VIDELEDQPRIDAEEAIRQARAGAAVPSQFPGEADDVAGTAPETTEAPRPQDFLESADLEVPTAAPSGGSHGHLRDRPAA
jgi:hypothetical protein